MAKKFKRGPETQAAIDLIMADSIGVDNAIRELGERVASKLGVARFHPAWTSQTPFYRSALVILEKVEGVVVQAGDATGTYRRLTAVEVVGSSTKDRKIIHRRSQRGVSKLQVAMKHGNLEKPDHEIAYLNLNALGVISQASHIPRSNKAKAAPLAISSGSTAPANPFEPRKKA